jgi:hypothetical protein
LRMVYADTGRRNRYGELTGAQHVGLTWGGAIWGEIFTRPHQWRITTAGVSGETVQNNSIHPHRAHPGTASQSSSPLPPLGPVAITVRSEADDIDPAEKWRFRTEALIGQLACQYRISERPKTQRKWTWDGDSSRIKPVYVHRETTGPPH